MTKTIDAIVGERKVTEKVDITDHWLSTEEEDVAVQIAALCGDKAEIKGMQEKYWNRAYRAEITARKLFTEAMIALQAYEKSEKKDETQFDIAHNKYRLYIMLHHALPEESRQLIGLERLPSDNIGYHVKP